MDRWTMKDAQKNNVARAHPYLEGLWCSKFGWIPPSGLGGDSMMDRRMDDGRKEKNVARAQPYHEGKWCSKFGWIPPSGLGGDSMMDRRMDDGRKEKNVTDRWMGARMDGHMEK